MASEVACGQIGCNCGAFAPYFLGFSLSLPVEAVFKGVQIVHIMLSLDPKGDRWHLSVSPTLLRSYPAGQVRRKEKGRPYHRRTGRPLAPIRLANNSCMWLYHAHGRGSSTSLLLCILSQL